MKAKDFVLKFSLHQLDFWQSFYTCKSNSSQRIFHRKWVFSCLLKNKMQQDTVGCQKLSGCCERLRIKNLNLQLSFDLKMIVKITMLVKITFLDNSKNRIFFPIFDQNSNINFGGIAKVVYEIHHQRFPIHQCQEQNYGNF